MRHSGINQQTSDPLYLQIIQNLKNDICTGHYPAGCRIPPESQLCSSYGVSRVTVRRALADLAAEGYLEKKQGKGTFVTARKVTQDLKAISSFHDTCRLNGMNASSKVICVRETEADETDIHSLNIQPGNHIIESVRVNSADGQPVILEINHYSMAYAYLLEADLNGSLYSLLLEYGVEPGNGIHDISLCMSDDKVSSLLCVEKHTPLLLLSEIIYDKLGRPLHTSKQYIRGDRLVFRI